jgi:DNA-binding LacI/PurR family transcriptional regulator
MSTAFQIKLPLPPRGSAEALRDQLIEHLAASRPAVGSRFLSDHDLVQLSQLSRPTVRKALEALRRQGWIERRHGSGTFIGPRAAMAADPRRAEPGRSTARLALLIHLQEDPLDNWNNAARRDAPDAGDGGRRTSIGGWYPREVLRGIDREAADRSLALEVLDQDADPKHIGRRLEQTRPDVVVFTGPHPNPVATIAQAVRLGIPAIGTGTWMGAYGIPSACEDGRQGARDAVRYLVAMGHRRIGFTVGPFATPWVFQRRQGWIDGLAEAGIEPDEGLVLWSNPGADGAAEETRAYLQRRQPTALLMGNYASVWPLKPLIDAGHLRVPDDLSVVTFDQYPNSAYYLNGAQPAVVRLPLERMGQELAALARRLTDGQPVPTVTSFPCELVPGDAVRKL